MTNSVVVTPSETLSTINKGVGKLQAIYRGQKVRRKISETINEFTEIVKHLEGEKANQRFKWINSTSVAIGKPAFVFENTVNGKLCCSKEEETITSKQVTHSDADSPVDVIPMRLDCCNEQTENTLHLPLIDHSACHSVKSFDNDVILELASGEEELFEEVNEENSGSTFESLARTHPTDVSTSDDNINSGNAEVTTCRTDQPCTVDIEASFLPGKEEIKTIHELPATNLDENTVEAVEASTSVPSISDSLQEEMFLIESESKDRAVATSTPVSSRRSSDLSDNLSRRPLEQSAQADESNVQTNRLLTESWMTNKSFHLSSVGQICSQSDSHEDPSLDTMNQEELEQQKTSIAMELLWIQQAIHSRKEYLRIKNDIR